MSRSTFSVLFYANKSKLKNGIVPIMGRVTINGTQSQFSCKQSIPLDLWDVKGNRAKGRSREALQLNRDLDSIKAQLIKLMRINSVLERWYAPIHNVCPSFSPSVHCNFPTFKKKNIVYSRRGTGYGNV